jgi:hypothetical protein
MALLLTSQRLHTLIWVLVYGGLLTLVLGLSVQRSDDDLGWSMVAVGLAVALLGFALVFVRARMKAD